MLSQKKILVLCGMIACLLTSRLSAQNDIQTSKIFDLYGSKKGSTLVVLTNEMLGNYNFALFKSISIKNNPQAIELTRKALEADETGAKKVKQVVVDGKTTSIILHLSSKGGLNRMVLFDISQDEKSKMTLIYLESRNDTESILKLILNKK